MGVEETVLSGQLLLASLIALAAGLVSFLSPCVLPLIPGYLAYVSGFASDTPAAVSAAKTTAAAASGANAVTAAQTKRTANRRRMVIGALLFVLGFTAVFMLLNILVGTVGLWLFQWQDLITRVLGVLVIVLGLVFMGIFTRLQNTNRLKFKPSIGLAGAPLLGVVFALGWTPCIGPTLAVVTSLSLQAGSVPRAAILGLMYCIGLGIPFVLAAFGFGWMTDAMKFFRKHVRVINMIGGGLLVLIGVLMVTGLWSVLMMQMQAVIANYGTVL